MGKAAELQLEEDEVTPVQIPFLTGFHQHGPVLFHPRVRPRGTQGTAGAHAQTHERGHLPPLAPHVPQIVAQNQVCTLDPALGGNFLVVRLQDEGTVPVVQEGEEAMVMTFTDVAINTGLEDSLFKKEE